MSDHPAPAPIPDENQLIAERRDKLRALRERQAGGHGVAFPNDYKPTHHAESLLARHAAHSTEELAAQAHQVRVAGRMMLKRVMGKASFATLQDSTGRIQIYVKGEDVGADAYEQFKHWDLGDIFGVDGHMFRTRTGRSRSMRPGCGFSPRACARCRTSSTACRTRS